MKMANQYSNNVYKFEADAKYVHDEAQEQAFVVFWRSGAPNIKEIAELVHVNPKTIQRWAKKFNWHARRLELRRRQDGAVLDEIGSPVEHIKEDVRLLLALRDEVSNQLVKRQDTMSCAQVAQLTTTITGISRAIVACYKSVGIDPSRHLSDEL
jgi:DNA-binding transcriptional MerR regulator